MDQPTTTHRILVVDDDPDIGTMIKMMLEYKGYSVVVVDRGEKVFEALARQNIRLIIMDMLLSGVNGTDICTSIKKNPVTSSVPLIMISAHPNAKDICLQAGADDFIAKPFEMDDLLSKIGRLIAANEGKRAS
jgi:DNA-binding response OmpR family regulator